MCGLFSSKYYSFAQGEYVLYQRSDGSETVRFTNYVDVAKSFLA